MSSEANDPVVVEKNLAMRARDGVTLFADVYRPAVPGRFPVLVIRTPYDKSVDNALTETAYFPPRGYVVVVQDTRGRFASEGEFYPFLHEATDGYDTIEWAAGRWCSSCLRQARLPTPTLPPSWSTSDPTAMHRISPRA